MRIPDKKIAILHFTGQGIGLGLVFGLLYVYSFVDPRPIPAFIGMTFGFLIYTHGLLLHKSSRIIDLEEEVFE